jgi:hypothetical protein
MYQCPRLMGTYLPQFARATPAMNSSLFSSRSAAAQRFTESRISRRSFSSWLFFSKVLRAVRISPDLVAIPSSLRSLSICSSSFFEDGNACGHRSIFACLQVFAVYSLSLSLLIFGCHSGQLLETSQFHAKSILAEAVKDTGAQLVRVFVDLRALPLLGQGVQLVTE